MRPFPALAAGLAKLFFIGSIDFVYRGGPVFDLTIRFRARYPYASNPAWRDSKTCF